MIQDDVIAACQIVFSIMLIPTLLSKKASVPILTSFVTGLGLMIIAAMMFSLGLWFSTVTALSNGTMWFAIAAWRQPPESTDAERAAFGSADGR